MDNIPTAKMDKSRFEGEGVGVVTLIKELGLVQSNSEGFRTIEQGGLAVGGSKVTDKKMNVTCDMFCDGKLLIQKEKEVPDDRNTIIVRAPPLLGGAFVSGLEDKEVAAFRAAGGFYAVFHHRRT